MTRTPLSVYSGELRWRMFYCTFSLVGAWCIALIYGDAWVHLLQAPLHAVTESRGRPLPLGSLVTAMPGEWLRGTLLLATVLSLAAVIPLCAAHRLLFLGNSLRSHERRRLLLWCALVSSLMPLARVLCIQWLIPAVLEFLLSRESVASSSRVTAEGGVPFQPHLGVYLSWVWALYSSALLARLLPLFWYQGLNQLVQPRGTGVSVSWQWLRRLGFRVTLLLAFALPRGDELWSPLLLWLPLATLLELTTLVWCLQRSYSSRKQHPLSGPGGKVAERSNASGCKPDSLKTHLFESGPSQQTP